MMTLKKITAVAVFVLALVAPKALFAQDMMQQPLPIDPQVKTGKLANGLTYFIRKNAQPKERAEFYIAQRVGSILEQEPQRGLAHFLEHMCFNGTKNFPDKGIINYLETIGVKFGYNLNAYTGIDETVYTIMEVPTTRQGIIDSCLMILHDWSGFVTLADEEIDKERGVIHEEWRQGQKANMRMIEQVLPRIYPNNVYGQRLPIGLMSVVDNFKYQELRDYYHKWYRPDLQAIIVVGDIDPDKVEADIKRIFSDIPTPVNPAERVYFPVEDNDEPIVAMAYDKEATATSLSIMYKFDPLPRELKGTVMGVLQDYAESAINQMINERFQEILNKPNAPFLDASGYVSNFFLATTKRAVSFDATAREGQLDLATKALVAEIAKIRQFGFTAGEYERARTNILKRYENLFNERDKQRNKTYADEYVSYFTKGGYIPGIEMEKQLIDQLAPNIPIEMINQMIQENIGDKNTVIMVMAPEKEGLVYPTEAQFLASYRNYLKQPVEAYKDVVSDQKLMEKAPKKGSIKSEKKGQEFNTTLLTLSNGAKVYVKKTDFKNNQVLFRMAKPGGTHKFNAPADVQNVKFFNAVSDLGGVAGFDAVTLGKVLTGRSISVNASATGTDAYMSGSSTVEDLETFFQLLYLQVTQNRKDNDAFKAFIEKQTEAIKNNESNPMKSFSDSVIYALYNNAPSHMSPRVEDLKKINYNRVMEMYNDIFSDMHDATFFFIGNVDVETLKPLLETYVASLPAKKRTNDRFLNREVAIRKSPLSIDFKADLATPTATVFDAFTGTMDYTLKNDLLMEIFSAVLDQVYMETVREQEGGTYGVNTGGSIEENPAGETILQIFFQTAPEKVDHLNKIIYRELDKLIAEGPNKEFFDKTIENMKKQYQEDTHQNGYWLGAMVNKFYRNKDFVSQYEATLSSIKPADVQEFAKKLVQQKNKIEVIVRSTKTEQDAK